MSEVPIASSHNITPNIVKNTPGLSSAERIRKAMIEEAEAKKSINIPISAEAITKVWKAYADNHNSKSSQSALNNVKLDWQETRIKVSTPTIYIKDLVLQETGLMEEIRSYFHNDELILLVEVDKEKFPDYEDLSALKVKLSSKEIYKAMLEKNPIIEDFIKSLGLSSTNQ